jgi:hypothetical protein
VNEYDKVMTENFAKRFVDHRHVGLAPKTVAELAFHHRERGLHIAALVVVLQKLCAPELEIVIHAVPRASSVTAMGRMATLDQPRAQKSRFKKRKK